MFEKLGKFEIKRILGQGAMGEVYLGTDPAIGREVAIKTILPSAASGGEAKERFAREAKAAGVLNHPNLVTIYEFGEDQGVLYIAMEFVRGHDLEELLRERSLTRTESLEILAQVCDGLAFAHRNQIVHRDIKPSNVRVLRDGKRLQAKVMDFGVARVGNSEMTATGMVMGTVSYMAPEYIRSGRPDPRSDLFAVGVMLYESLSGRKPFSGDTTPTILYKIVNEPPEPIDLTQLHGISPAIRSVLDRSLDKDPDHRYQTADELARALRAAKDPTWAGQMQEGTALLAAGPAAPPAEATRMQPMASPTTLVPPSAVPPPPLPAAPARPAAKSGSAGPILAVAALGALLVLGGGGFAFWKWRQGAPPTPAAATPATAATLDPTPATAPTGTGTAGTMPVLRPDPPRPVEGGTARRSQGQEPVYDPSPSRPEPVRAEPERPQRPASNDPFAPENLRNLEAPQRMNLANQTMSEATAIMDSDPAGAVRGLRNAIAANPREARAYAWAVVILYQQGRYQECRDILNKAAGAGVSQSQMMANARFRALMNSESFNHRIPD